LPEISADKLVQITTLKCTVNKVGMVKVAIINIRKRKIEVRIHSEEFAIFV
jgi:hypothetical protein